MTFIGIGSTTLTGILIFAAFIAVLWVFDRLSQVWWITEAVEAAFAWTVAILAGLAGIAFIISFFWFIGSSGLWVLDAIRG